MNAVSMKPGTKTMRPSVMRSTVIRSTVIPRRRLSTVIVLAGLGVGAGISGAAAVAAEGAQPYAGQQHRALKALSDDDLRGLREGEGMGMAKAAELNHYPGPRHVLDLADALALAPSTRQQVETIFQDMSAKARDLGGQIITLEQQLDAHFRDGSIDPEILTDLTLGIGRLRGQLRAVHLAAHLQVRSLLSDDQVAAYDKRRGYTDGGGGGGHGAQGGHDDHGGHGAHGGQAGHGQ